MACTNCYATVNEVKQRLFDNSQYTAATISFTSATKTIADSANGLRHFQANEIVRVSGSSFNDGDYTVVTGNSAGSFTVSESLSDEAASATVTLVNVIDQAQDNIIESILEAVSRRIDEVTADFFYQASQTRYYSPEESNQLFVDSLVSVTSIKSDTTGDGVFDTTWLASDFQLAPYNAALDGDPYTRIETTPLGVQTFRRARRTTEVVGTFGWPAVPMEIKEATILYAERLFKRKDAIFGVVGATLGGGALAQAIEIRAVDPDVLQLVMGKARRLMWAV